MRSFIWRFIRTESFVGHNFESYFNLKSLIFTQKFFNQNCSHNYPKSPVDLINLRKSLHLMMSARRVNYSILFDFVQNFRPFSYLFGKNLMLSSRMLVYRMVLLTNRSRD